jgi:hypothetical protein
MGIASGPAGPDGAQAFAVALNGSPPAIVTDWPAISVTPLDLDDQTDAGPIALADVNADGFEDVVSLGPSTIDPAGTGHLTARLNQGDGTFAPFTSTDTPGQPVGMALMALDGDAYPDAVTINAALMTRSVFHGNGDGTFTEVSRHPLGFPVPDLMFAFDSPPVYGEGFHLGHTFALARMRGPSAPPDLLVLDADQPRVHLYEGDASGNFSANGTLDVSSSPTAIATGDMDGDGFRDVVTANQNGNNVDTPTTLTIWFGDGAGGYGRRADYLLDVPGVIDMQVGDMSGSHRSEVVLYRWPAHVVPQILTPQVRGVARTTGVADAGLEVVRSFEFGTPVLGVGGRPHTTPGVVSLSVAPNPSRSRAALWFALPVESSASLEILDVAGRRVRTFRSGVFAAGEHVIPWDGRGDDGARVPAGILFARLTTGREHAVRRLVWIP